MSEHDELVEKVAQEPWPEKVWLGGHLFQNSYDDGSYYCYELRASIKFADRAAIAAMAPINEMWIGDYMLRLAPNGVWIGRPGGEGGEFATEHVERVIAQFYREQF